MGRILLRVCVGLIVGSTSWAVSQTQTGTVAGVIHDQESGEELVGANVLLEGSSLGAAADIEGKYLLRNITPGTYTLRFSLVGYSPKVVDAVVVRAGETTQLDINLSPVTYKQDEVVVTAERVLGTEASILADRKKAVAIGDGISAEQIKRTPDATSGDALKRITGLSIVDNKFVFVRGITDRYNNTTLDGASVTSTDAGKKGFSFDLLPANLLENTTVVKSATPDLPGDFTGGLVQLSTLDFPDRMTIKASFTSAYNSLTTSKGFLRSQGSGTDWLGADNGARSFPGDYADGNQLAQHLQNNWAPRSTTAPANAALALSFGDRMMLTDNDAGGDQLGFLGALTYRSNFQRNDREIDDRDQSRFSLGTRDDYSVLWGGIANLSWKFGGVNKISFKNNYNRSGEDQISAFEQQDKSLGLTNQIGITSWTERSIYTGQLIGEHLVEALGGLSVQWRASLSSSRRRDPDRKETIYYRASDDPTSPWTIGNNKRSWQAVDDRTESGALDLSLPLGGAKVKAGFFMERKTADFSIRYFRGGADYFGGIPDSLTHLPIDEVYAPENFGPGKFLFGEITRPTDNYAGEERLLAGYAMVDLPFEVVHQHFRLAGGVRAESFRQDVGVPQSLDPKQSPAGNRLQVTDYLPSVNFTYMVSDIMNLRLAYSHSVNRPEFRERALTVYEDFVLNELVAGNPSLSRAYVRNYDVRFEIFPGIGELFAVSYFHKNITSAIEEQLLFSGTRTRLYFNSDRARNYGWEFEARKSLSFLGGYFGAFSVTGNYTRIFSAVEFLQTVGNSSDTRILTATRPMQGQSPYMINLSLLFTEPTLGTTINLLYNKAGRRLQTVGFLASDIYEEPRDLVDLSINQPLPVLAGLEAKLTVRNLADKDRVLVRDEQQYDRTATGRTWSLQFSYSY